MTRPVAELVVLEPARVSVGRTSSPSWGEDVPCETSPSTNMPPNSHQIIKKCNHCYDVAASSGGPTPARAQGRYALRSRGCSPVALGLRPKEGA
ncbi:hypothetical protein T03_4243 [Trichinella britovi]|uniref:Uncharacterized protein n=1 Tax=Trichinella britovi TaxID=45882 RepID=A0A0V1C680_TRIBR|nr:hypothetical protein T03_4243 [Trichinella britovi]